MTKVIKQKKAHNGWFAILDIFITIFSYYFAYYLTNQVNKDYFSFTSEYVIMLLLIIPTWVILLHAHNLTQLPRTRSHVSVFFNLLNFSFVGFALIFLYKYLFGLTNFSHFVIFSFSIVNLFSLYLFRITTYRIFKYYRVNGHNISNIIVYADDRSNKFLDNIIEHKEWGFSILMIISDSIFIKKKYGPGIRIYPDKININNILDNDIIDEVIYCKSSIDDTKLDDLIKTCEEIGVTFRLQSDLYPLSKKNVQLTHFQNLAFVTFVNTPKSSIALLWKTYIEFWISFCLIFLLSPIMLLITFLIKATLNGPVIFKQERVGLRGRKFYVYKFRTMVYNAEALKEKLMILNESDGPVFKMKNDPRITNVGRFLRKTGLDELPQLFNVLKGEMSLVGPRPPLQSEVDKYKRWHLRRLSIKPGITCTWQIIPNRNHVIFDDWMKLDIQYIKSWSVKTDIILLFRTVKTTLLGTGF
jgi:exopolysaccharide biosynthesis polyprenyl glycosylphosphotransferase